MHHVLVVDDDQITLELLQHILEEHITGTVLTINNGAEAIGFLDRAKLKELHLVICDWQMPDYDGIDVLKALRSKSRDVPFLMLTANATRDLVISARNAGVSDFVAKPFRNDELMQKVNKLLKKA